MTEHTPGPWHWEGGTNYEFAQLVGAGRAPVLWLVSLDGDCVMEVEDADATLITAAPDMLEALRFVQKHGLALKDSPMFDIVGRAIAKAEGKD